MYNPDRVMAGFSRNPTSARATSYQDTEFPLSQKYHRHACARTLSGFVFGIYTEKSSGNIY
jgi:hypothetical protein